jgi:hypothetical protein
MPSEEPDPEASSDLRS